MRGISTVVPSSSRLAVATLLVGIAGCASSPPGSETLHPEVRSRVLAALERDSVQALRGPNVRLRTERDFGFGSRIAARLRVEEDAYVAVVNVAPDGTARMIFPEDPRDDGFLTGGKSYAIPAFFPGYATAAMAHASAGSGPFIYYRNSVHVPVSTRGPGYTFVIASWEPLRLAYLEEQGLFDGVDLGRNLWDLEPARVVTSVLADAMQPRQSVGLTVDIARYGGYSPSLAMQSVFASSFMSSTCSSRYGVGAYGFGRWNTFYDDGFSFTPMWDPCASDYRNRGLAGRRPVSFRPDSTTKDSTGTDSTKNDSTMSAPGRRAAEVLADIARQIDAAGADGERDAVVELTPAARMEERRAERREAASRGLRSTSSGDDFGASAGRRARRSEAHSPRAGRAEGRRSSDTGNSGQAPRASTPRSSEPRAASPRNTEPRGSEPRASQPRSEPAARPAPAASSPRGEGTSGRPAGDH